MFVAQVICAIEAGYIDKTQGFDWMRIIRFMVEEGSRRLIGKSTEPPTKKQQSNFLNHKRTDEIVAKAMEIKGLDENLQLTQNEMLERLQGGADQKKGKEEEEAKVKALLEDEIDSLPCIAEVEKEGSEEHKLVQQFNESINKKLSWVKVLIGALELENIPVPSTMSDLKCFKENLVCYAMIFQNSLHPNNKARRESIESKTYVEIVTRDDADEYLRRTYRSLLELEISGEETRIIMVQNAHLYSNISDMSLVIRDMYAFAEIIRGLKVGDGGVISLIKAMEKKSSLSAYSKLKIIVNRSFDGTTMFADDYKQDPGNLRFNKSHLYKLYIRYSYVNKEITNKQFVELFPHVTEHRMEKWISNYEKNPKNRFIVK